MDYSIAMTETLSRQMQSFLLKDTTEEEVCFVTWRPSQGVQRCNILLNEAIYPEKNERKKHGTVSAQPSYVKRCEEFAVMRGAGLAMIHTHPFGVGIQHVSKIDRHSEQDILAKEVFGITGLPFVGITLSGDNVWSGRIYPKPFKIRRCQSVRIVGKNLAIDFNPPVTSQTDSNPMQVRTVSLWGNNTQNNLARMKVGIIGVGSVGSAVSEILARMGIGTIFLMDYDSVGIHNLDRMIGAYKTNVGMLKKDAIRKNIIKVATSKRFACITSNNSIVEKAGVKEALDCDVIFCCVDRPWPRLVLNQIAYSSLIPVIDGGISFDVTDGKMQHGVYRAQTIGVERACLDCSGGLRLEQVERDRQGTFDDPEYIKKQEASGKNTRYNIIPFSLGLASMETIQFVEMVTNIAGIGDMKQQTYDYTSGEIIPKPFNCREKCTYRQLTANGDSVDLSIGMDKSRSRSLE